MPSTAAGMLELQGRGRHRRRPPPRPRRPAVAAPTAAAPTKPSGARPGRRRSSIKAEGNQQAKTTNAPPRSGHEPCYSHSSCRGRRRQRLHSLRCRRHCDSGHVPHAQLYLGGCALPSTTRATSAPPPRPQTFIRRRRRVASSRASVTLALPRADERLMCHGWSLSADPILDDSMDRLLNGSLPEPSRRLPRSLPFEKAAVAAS